MPTEAEFKFNWTVGPASSYEEEVAGKYAYVERGLTHRFAGDKITETQAIEAEGVNTLQTPAVGWFVTLYWVGISTAKIEPAILVTVKIGEQTAYEWYLTAGCPFSHWEPLKGEINQPLTITLSGAAKVAVSYTFTESLN